LQTAFLSALSQGFFPTSDKESMVLGLPVVGSS
jgi:hypothetical protein